MSYSHDDTSPQIKFTPRKESYTSQSEVTKPTGNPKSNKDFSKILRKHDEDSETEDGPNVGRVSDEEEEGDSSLAEVSPRTRKVPSLFDLTGGKAMKNTFPSESPAAMQKNDSLLAELSSAQAESSDLANDKLYSRPNAASNKNQMDSPSSLYAKLTSADAKKHLSKEDSFEGSSSAGSNNKLTTAQPELSSVNLMSTPNQLQSVTEMSSPKQALPVSHVQEIIDQLVQSVTEMKSNGLTETTLTLKQPPLFANVMLVVTSYDNAKGEFNLSFGNLTQAAKNILDLEINQNALKLSLDQKGYAVHIINTSTLAENRLNIETPPPSGSQTGRQRSEDETEDKRRGQRDQA